MIHLVLGGARSGKTRYASNAAKACGENGYRCVYIATAQALDDEMDDRITRHKSDREADSLDWISVETPLNLLETLQEYAQEDRVILVDCLTLWLTNHLMLEDSSRGLTCGARKWNDDKQALLSALPGLPGEIYLISNEVGCGIVPMGEINRRFVDEAGWLHQEIAGIADTVTLVTAGLPMRLKG